MHNTKQLSHSYPLSYAQHSMSQKQQRKGTEKSARMLYRNEPTSLDHLTCLEKIKARNTRITTNKSLRIYVCV